MDRKYILSGDRLETDLTERQLLKMAWRLALIVLISTSAGAAIGYYWGPSRIPRCTYAPDVIIGNGEYDSDTGYWSEYDCISESAFSDHNTVNRKSRMQP